MIRGSDTNLYGTTIYGGASNDGTVFKLTPSGSLSTYSFCSQANCADGENPDASLIQASNGTFYGTTEEGGAHGFGTVFQLGGSPVPTATATPTTIPTATATGTATVTATATPTATGSATKTATATATATPTAPPRYPHRDGDPDFYRERHARAAANPFNSVTRHNDGGRDNQQAEIVRDQEPGEEKGCVANHPDGIGAAGAVRHQIAMPENAQAAEDLQDIGDLYAAQHYAADCYADGFR